MKFNKTAVQKELDMAAEELEKAGHADLASKVDYYGGRLMTATAGEVPLLRRALSRILDEAKRRMAAVEKKEPSEAEKKAQAATQNTRRAGDARKELFQRRLKEIAMRRDAAKNKLNSLRTARQERTAAAAEKGK